MHSTTIFVKRQANSLDPNDVHSGSFEHLVNQLLLTAFFVSHRPRVESHVYVGPGSSVLGEHAGINNEDAFDDLD